MTRETRKTSHRIKRVKFESSDIFEIIQDRAEIFHSSEIDGLW